MVLMSEKNMDDLLAQLEEEFEPKQSRRSNVEQSQSRPAKQPPQSSKPNVSMDKMLAELRAELESGRGRPNKMSSMPEKPAASAQANKPSTTANSAKSRGHIELMSRDRLNALIDTDYRRQAHKREEKFAEIKRQEEAKLAQIKRQEEAKIAEQKRHEQELIELQKREELRERRRKEALREAAKEWLVKLNPRSEEGKWFEEFSYSYEDKLKAAIDYLEAMRETGL